MEYKRGQVLNFTWNNFYGNIIQIYNLRTYGKRGPTHSAIIGKVKPYSVLVYQALNQGFVISEFGKGELDNYLKSGHMKVGTPIKKLTYVKKNANKYLGNEYGWTDIVDIALYSLFGIKIRGNSKQLICSEAVSRVLYDSSNKQINFEKEFNKPFDLITPSDLQNSKQIKWD